MDKEKKTAIRIFIGVFPTVMLGAVMLILAFPAMHSIEL